MAIQISRPESGVDISSPARTAPAASTSLLSGRRSGWGSGLRPALAMPQAALLSFLLVAAATWLLFCLERYLIGHDHLRGIRPFGVGYFVPVIILTACGGRRAGWLTLCLSTLSAVFFLTRPFFSWHIQTARDWTEIGMLLAVGSLIVPSVEAMRRNTLMFAEITDTVEGRDILRAVRRQITEISGVCGIQNCVLRRRGFDIYFDLDVTADETVTLEKARRIVEEVERAAYRSHPLIFHVRARVI